MIANKIQPTSSTICEIPVETVPQIETESESVKLTYDEIINKNITKSIHYDPKYEMFIQKANAYKDFDLTVSIRGNSESVAEFEALPTEIKNRIKKVTIVVSNEDFPVPAVHDNTEIGLLLLSNVKHDDITKIVGKFDRINELKFSNSIDNEKIFGLKQIVESNPINRCRMHTQKGYLELFEQFKKQIDLNFMNSCSQRSTCKINNIDFRSNADFGGRCYYNPETMISELLDYTTTTHILSMLCYVFNVDNVKVTNSLFASDFLTMLEKIQINPSVNFNSCYFNSTVSSPDCKTDDCIPGKRNLYKGEFATSNYKVANDSKYLTHSPVIFEIKNKKDYEKCCKFIENTYFGEHFVFDIIFENFSFLTDLDVGMLFRKLDNRVCKRPIHINIRYYCNKFLQLLTHPQTFATSFNTLTFRCISSNVADQDVKQFAKQLHRFKCNHICYDYMLTNIAAKTIFFDDDNCPKELEFKQLYINTGSSNFCKPEFKACFEHYKEKSKNQNIAIINTRFGIDTVTEFILSKQKDIPLVSRFEIV